MITIYAYLFLKGRAPGIFEVILRSKENFFTEYCMKLLGFKKIFFVHN